jgi:hypothetical protein
LAGLLQVERGQLLWRHAGQAGVVGMVGVSRGTWFTVCVETWFTVMQTS